MKTMLSSLITAATFAIGCSTTGLQLNPTSPPLPDLPDVIYWSANEHSNKDKIAADHFEVKSDGYRHVLVLRNGQGILPVPFQGELHSGMISASGFVTFDSGHRVHYYPLKEGEEGRVVPVPVALASHYVTFAKYLGQRVIVSIGPTEIVVADLDGVPYGAVVRSRNGVNWTRVIVTLDGLGVRAVCTARTSPPESYDITKRATTLTDSRANRVRTVAS